MEKTMSTRTDHELTTPAALKSRVLLVQLINRLQGA
jgi:hypothetical protein